MMINRFKEFLKDLFNYREYPARAKDNFVIKIE